MGEGVIYVFKLNGCYKIGSSKNIKERIKHFECSLPGKMETIFIANVKDYLSVEKFLHRKFKDKRVRREWFNLSEADIEFIKAMDYKEKDDIDFGMPEIDLSELLNKKEIME